VIAASNLMMILRLVAARAGECRHGGFGAGADESHFLNGWIAGDNAFGEVTSAAVEAPKLAELAAAR